MQGGTIHICEMNGRDHNPSLGFTVVPFLPLPLSVASPLFLNLSVGASSLAKGGNASGSGGPGASLVAHMVKNLPAIQETQV